jgi:hypothetical protein
MEEDLEYPVLQLIAEVNTELFSFPCSPKVTVFLCCFVFKVATKSEALNEKRRITK